MVESRTTNPQALVVLRAHFSEVRVPRVTVAVGLVPVVLADLRDS